MSGRAIGERTLLPRISASSAIHRKVQNDWHDVFPIVNALALRLHGKREMKAIVDNSSLTPNRAQA